MTKSGVPTSERYYVQEITSKQAKEKLSDHYLNRDPQVSYAFGLFDRQRGNSLNAVVTFGSPASPSVTKGLAGEDYRGEVIEMNRLWVDSSVSNVALKSFLESAFSRVPKKYIISYVQPERDRIARLFKQLGLHYLGLTAAHRDPMPTGDYVGKHNRHAHYGLSKANMVQRPRKHRFVKINTSNEVEKSQLFGNLKYEVLSY